MILTQALATAWQRVFGTVPEPSTCDLAARLRDVLPAPEATVSTRTPVRAAQQLFRAEEDLVGALAELIKALDDPDTMRADEPGLADLAAAKGSPWAAAYATFGGRQ